MKILNFLNLNLQYHLLEISFLENLIGTKIKILANNLGIE